MAPGSIVCGEAIVWRMVAVLFKARTTNGVLECLPVLPGHEIVEDWVGG